MNEDIAKSSQKRSDAAIKKFKIFLKVSKKRKKKSMLS